MAALLIGPEQRQKIAELRAFAAANIHDPARIIADTAEPAAEDAHRDYMAIHTIELPVGYVVTYSLERQPPGLCHHLSVSVDRPNKMPDPAAVEMILEAFGMAPMQTSIRVWIEEVDATTKAVSIVQAVT